MSNPLLDYIDDNKKDGILFKTLHLLDAAGDDIYKKSAAIEEINQLIAVIPNDIVAETYTKLVAGHTGIKFATITKSVKEAKDKTKEKEGVQNVGEGKKALPKWVNRERLEEIGFEWRVDPVHTENTGMYFPTFGGHLQQLTNFVIRPIIQIKSFNVDDRRRITEVFNGKKSHVFELPSAAFISPERFESTLLDQGYFICNDGFAKSSLNKIKSYYMAEYPEGIELKKLGWQPEGFFAFSNVIYKDGLIKFNDYGIAQVDEVNYLSMGASNILKGIRSDEDIYKNDKTLKYVEAPISFHRWTELMVDVYDDKGMMGVAWVMLAANRDIVMERNSYCPIPYLYGGAGGGKSQMANSCVAPFTINRKPYNLNNGTDFSLFVYLDTFRNILALFNEFDVQAIEEKKSRVFKGAADGEGREKGSGQKGKSTTQEINSTPLLVGQYLANMDGNSILSRSLPEKVTENLNRTAEQIANFDELKEHEHKGMTSLSCQLFHYRTFIEENYQDTYDEVRRQLKRDFEEEGQSPQTRSQENYATVATLVKLYGQKLSLAFSYEDFYAYCKSKIVNLHTMVGESNNLGEFWTMVQSLTNQGIIEPGWDYKIETHTEVKSMLGAKDSKTALTFEKPTRLLFIKLKDVYGFVAKEKKALSGKPAIGPDTIKTYLIDQPYYLGTQSNGNFKSKKFNKKHGTSSMVLNYDLLILNNDINLEFSDGNDDPRELVHLEGHLKYDAKLKDIFGVEKITFTLFQDESYLNAQQFQVEKHVFTSCFYMNKEMLYALKLGAKVAITGMLSVTTKGENIYRNMEVQQLEVLEAVPGTTAPTAAQRFTPTPVQSQIRYDEVPTPGPDEEPEF